MLEHRLETKSAIVNSLTIPIFFLKAATISQRRILSKQMNRQWNFWPREQ
jgi:hypothetical protein